MSCYLAGGGHLQGVQLASDHVNPSSTPLLTLQQRPQARIQKTTRLLLRRLGLTSQDLEQHLNQIDERRSQLVNELDASRNHISVLPNTLIRFTNLTNLILSSNNLTFIPYEIYSNAKQLRLLVLSENEISVIPEDMPHFLTELITLKLDDNRIEVLPYTIYHMEKLENLQLGSDYGGNFLESLPDTISSLTALKELNVSYNRIQELPDRLFEENTLLEYINLSHNHLLHLPTALLRHLVNLKTLDLSYNHISTIPTTTLDDMLRLTMSKLEFIDISNNRLFILPAELLDQNRAQVIVRGNPFSQYLGDNSTDDDGSYNQVVRNMTRIVVPVSEYASSSMVTRNSDSAAQQSAAQEDTHAIDRTLSTLANTMHLFEERVGGALEGTIREQEDTVQDDESGYAPILDNDTVNILINNDSSSPAPLFLSLREIAYRLLLANITDISSLPTDCIPQHITTDIRDSLVQKCPVCYGPYVHEWVSTVQVKGQSAVRKVRFCRMECWKEYKRNIEEKMRYYQENRIARQEIAESIRQNPIEENTIDWIVAAVNAANEQEEERDMMANI
ncbi:L domain-like protein [Backusella circina FSU 941]|nr:L domain-like protein [Backusella circina FSU 941]